MWIYRGVIKTVHCCQDGTLADLNQRSKEHTLLHGSAKTGVWRSDYFTASVWHVFELKTPAYGL